jgi:thiamine kinase-like enzyme
MLAQASAIRYSPVMILNPEIERIFETTPILAEIPRSRWQVTPLGGLTNQTYRLRADDRDLVLRWPGPAASRYVDRRAELINIRKLAALDLAPALLAADPKSGWYITRFETGAHALTGSDFSDPEVLREVIALLTRLHRSDIRFPFQQGLFTAIDLYIDLYIDLAPTEGMLDLRRRLEPVETALQRHRMPLVPCHIDPSPANFLRRSDGKLLLIDWEFAAMEEPLWDLAAVALESNLEDGSFHALVEPIIGSAQIPRFELYETALSLVAASWYEAEIQAGNDAAALTPLRDAATAWLEQRLADPRHRTWLETA